MPDKRGTWSEERIAQLKRFHQDGLTSSQIAREIGVTRNAVIGKLSRLGLSRPRDVVRAQQKRAAKLLRPRRARFSIVAKNGALAPAFAAPPPPAATPTAPAIEVAPVFEGRGCTLLELSHGKCRWPIDGPDGKEVFFCGNDRVEGLPYCSAHARLAYRPSAARQRSGAEA